MNIDVNRANVALAIAILAILSLAAVVVFRPILVVRTVAPPIKGLSVVSRHARACVFNDRAWDATVADPENESLRCIREGKPCDVASLKPPATYLKLKASSGPRDTCFPGHTTKPGATTDGLTKDGVACAGFSEAGNEACPYRFNVYWQPECPDNAASCVNPTVRINGDLVRGSRDPQATKDTELARWAMRTVRGRSARSRVIVLNESAPAGSPAPGPPCSLQGSVRVFNHGFDAGGYVRFGKQGLFEFAPGNYACRISVPAYRVGSFKALLLDMSEKPGRPILSGTSEYSPLVGGYAQTRSEIAGTFRLRRRTPLAVVQVCAASASPEDESRKSLGVPSHFGSKAEEVYSVLECRVL